MGKKIIVAGAGHGGLSAAYTLAKNGYDVTVYERNKEKDLGYDWGDFFDMKAFSAAGLPLPPKGVVDRIPIAYYAPDISIPPLYEPEQTGFEMFMQRKDIYKYLIKHCKSAGVKFVFGKPVLSALILGDRVCGIKTEDGDIYGDLVIDACGYDSPVRLSLPDYFGTEKQYDKEADCLYVYRGIYKRNDECDDGPQYKVFLEFDENESVGMRWLITYDDHVDILIGKLYDFGEETIKEKIKDLQNRYPQISDKLISGGQVNKIPIRQSPAIFVANGYAGVGDTACMTMPVMGSGIAASLRAGALLAKTVMADADEKYNAETLWKYEVAYMKNIGFGLGSIAIVKMLIPDLVSDDVNFLFSSGVLRDEDMTFSAEDGSVGALISGIRISTLLERVKKASANMDLVKKISNTGINIIKYKSLTASFPTRYSRQSAKKWSERYNDLFGR
ncbi:MAG: NAD(P)/FAD-dependent oxidoreductase [Clostridia bacterium]|nr:NAD(P)/FAD-dependent oxidoreductase [Clostridia bacterium]